MTDALSAGMAVRLVADPGRIGTLTGKTRKRGDQSMLLVRFPEGTSWYPDYELLPVNDDDHDIFELLRLGRYGRLRDLRGNLTRIQLSGRLANMVYSMGATNTDFFAYQYKPVLAMLESPSNGLLIADEVGLGKTIEAGLIWTELRARYDARRLIVLCPAMLRDKWCTELARRFGIKAESADASRVLQELRKPRGEIPDGEALVASLQGLRPPKGWQAEDHSDDPRVQLSEFLADQEEDEPLVDLLVVDEAHYLRNPESQTAKLGNLFRGASGHMALLSATPINLHSDDLYYLLRMVDPDSFSDRYTFPMVLEANEPLHKARHAALDLRSGDAAVRTALETAAESPLLLGNRQIASLLKPGEIESLIETRGGRVDLAGRIERINPLRHVVTRTCKRDVNEHQILRSAHPEFVEMTATERDFYLSVTEAIRDYAEHCGISAGFLLSSPQRQVASCMPAAAHHWQDRNDTTAELEELIFEDSGDTNELDGHISPLLDHLAMSVLPGLDVERLEAEDSKYARVRDLITAFLESHDGEKVVLFSYFRKTLEYLSRRLNEDGISSELLMGGIQESKQQVIDRFRESKAKILISSEVAAEGVDLQFCRLLINYDLPWNPMRVEQRIGRLDRIGQTADKIDIWNLGYADTIDQRIYERLFERLLIFERALGGMEAILGDATRQLTIDLLSGRLTPEEEAQRIEQAALAIENKRIEEERLEAEASSLIAHSGHILEHIRAAHDFHHRVSAEDLIIFVRDYLDKYYPGFEMRPDGTNERRFRLRLSPALCGDLEPFLRQRRFINQTRLARGDEVACEFANSVNLTSGQHEIISQFHPLVRFITNDLNLRDESSHPLIGIRLSGIHCPDVLSPGDYAFAVRKWVFSGLRTEEALKAVIIPLYGDHSVGPIPDDTAMEIIHQARMHGSDWESPAAEYHADQVESCFDICQQMLETAFDRAREHWQSENDDRVSFQRETAKRHLERQLGKKKELLHRHEEAGQTGPIRMVKGQINKIQQRFDARTAKLEQQANATASHDDVCYGVLRVEDGYG